MLLFGDAGRLARLFDLDSLKIVFKRDSGDRLPTSGDVLDYDFNLDAIAASGLR